MRSIYARFTAPKAAVLLAGLWGVALGVVAKGQQSGSEGQDTAQQQAALMDEGQAIFGSDCAACHGAEGNEGAAPALAGNGSLVNKDHVVRQILHGTPARGMPAFAATLKDHQVAAVATFIRNSWENAYGVVLEADVKPLRGEPKKDGAP
jgi:mono/diheme cytochrome c family protein